MTKQETTRPKPRNPGADASNAAASYWHRMACRVYLHLQHTDPKTKGDARLEKIAKHLNALGVRARGNRRLNVESVRSAIKSKKRSQEFTAIQQIYADIPDAFLDFDPARELAAAIERDADGVSWNLDGALDNAASALERADLSPAAQEFERKRTYNLIAQRGAIRLKAILSQCELEWYALQQISRAAGVEVGDFPAKVILANAFPSFASS